MTKEITLTHPQGRGRLSRALFLFRGRRSLRVSMIMISARNALRCHSLPTRVPPVRPEKGKDRASSGQSSSSLSDHISTMLQKQNARFKRAETARKTARKTTGSLRVSTSDLIRAVQKPSSGSEVSSAATRVRRGQLHDLPVYSTTLMSPPSFR
ncbi:hypothetical protein EDB19DRAFT_548456 [Suillus lakei]|nr:hypothetical protein EDB19DRAFT_548456 [Suillus lakei]